MMSINLPYIGLFMYDGCNCPIKRRPSHLDYYLGYREMNQPRSIGTTVSVLKEMQDFYWYVTGDEMYINVELKYKIKRDV